MLGSGFGCAPLFLAGVLGRVCWCARSACTPPVPAGVCGVWVGYSLARAPVPWFFACSACFPRLQHPVAAVAWHMSVCLGCNRRHASFSCLMAPQGVPRLVRSGRYRCSGRLSRRCGAFPHPGGLRPRIHWAAAWGTWRPAENQDHGACLWPLPRQGRWARSASYPFRAPRWGCTWRIPPALVLGCLRCGELACADPVTRASSYPNNPSLDIGVSWCTGVVSCARRHLSFRVGGRHVRVPCVCVCVRALLGRVGRAGLRGAF